MTSTDTLQLFISDSQENVVINEGTVDQEFTANDTSSNLTANEKLVDRKTLEKCCDERIDWEKDNLVDTVEDGIQNTILTAIDTLITPKTDLAVKLVNVSSVQHATSVTASSELRTWGTCSDYCPF